MSASEGSRPMTEPCPCDACERFRAAKAQPRAVRYFDRIVPAWHVPLTAEWRVYDAALTAMSYAHPRESSMGVVNPGPWRALVAQT